MDCIHYSSYTDRCDNIECGVGDRCTVCDEKFVPIPNMVCDECEPGMCDACGNSSHMIYKVLDRKPSKTHSLAVKHMGMGAYHGQCLTCREFKTLGDSKICLQCSISKLSMRPLRVCYDCLHVSENEWISDDRDNCGSCGEYKVLNAERICESCYELRNKEVRCVECQIAFKPSHRHQILCYSCMPRCLGCGQAFNAKYRSDNFCKTCGNKAAMNFCLNCNKQVDVLSTNGKCLSCDDTTSWRHWCKICLTEEVESQGMVCQECLLATKDCPECGEVRIRSIDYMCKSCYEKRDSI